MHAQKEDDGGEGGRALHVSRPEELRLDDHTEMLFKKLVVLKGATWGGGGREREKTGA